MKAFAIAASRWRMPDLVLLPGLDGTGRRFADFIDALPQAVKTQVVAYPADVPLGYDELERQVRDELPRDRPFVLLGESFSGPIAIRIAADPPAGLTGVILCATFARNPYPSLAWTAPVAQFLPIKSMPRWLRAAVMWGSTNRNRAPPKRERAITGVASAVVRRRIIELLSCDATLALRRISLPLLVLYGRQDRVISRRATHWIDANAPGATLVSIDGPHVLLQSKPMECAMRVVDFLRRSDHPCRRIAV